MSEGYVYILSNKAMPGLLKIGRSKNGGRIRARELYQTGVPYPFELEFEIYVNNCVEFEQEVHARFNEYRLNQGREFFEIETEEAIRGVTDEYLNAFGLVVQYEPLIVNEIDIEYLRHLVFLEEGVLIDTSSLAQIIRTQLTPEMIIEMADDYFDLKHKKLSIVK